MERILLINTYYFPNGKGGAERSTKILAESLAKLGYRVFVITTSRRNDMSILNGVYVYYLNMGNLYWLPESKKHPKPIRVLWHVIDSYGLNKSNDFEKLLRELNPDLAITNSIVQFSCKIIDILRKCNIPVIHIIRDHYLMNVSTVMTNRQLFIKNLILGKFLSIRKKMLSNYPIGVIGISQYILNTHLKNDYFSRATIKTVIPNAIEDTGDFTEFVKRKPVFGYVGALNSRKGVDLLIDAFSANRIENELLLFGSGEDGFVNKLKGRIKSYPNIKLCGYQDAMSIYPSIDFLIVPSIINEAFGRVIIEAYSYGIPVIGSNRGGIPELIEHSKTGFLFEPEEKNSLIKVIVENKLNVSSIPTLRKNAFEKSKHYVVDNIIESYVQVISSVMFSREPIK